MPTTTCFYTTFAYHNLKNLAEMKYIGAHVSVESGVSNAPLNAAKIGAKAFALFTRNPSRWTSPALKDKEVAAFKANCIELGYSPEHILPHDSYLINLGSPDPEKLQKSREAFLDEFRRCEQLGLTMLNFHPGSHLKLIDTEACLDLIAESINLALEQTAGVKAVIENTAGQGSNLGFTFAQIGHIISKVTDKSRIGVCVDTCHAFAAGYNLATPDGYKAAWDEFDREIGFEYLSAMHINDSKKGVGCKVDRHECIGKGAIGENFFKMLMADKRMDNIPLILETPDMDLWQQEIEWLYSLVPSEAE